jgi:hypothetical protein
MTWSLLESRQVSRSSRVYLAASRGIVRVDRHLGEFGFAQRVELCGGRRVARVEHGTDLVPVVLEVVSESNPARCRDTRTHGRHESSREPPADVNDLEQTPSPRGETGEHAVDGAERIADGRAAEPSSARARHHEPEVPRDWRPQKVERERRVSARESDSEHAR